MEVLWSIVGSLLALLGAYAVLGAVGPTEIGFALMILASVGCSGVQAYSGHFSLLLPTLFVGALGVAGLLALRAWRASEQAVLAELFPRTHVDGRVGEYALGGRALDVCVSVERAGREGPTRFFDARVVVLSARVASDGVTLHRRGSFDRTWPPPTGSVESRYWLDASVCAALASIPDACIHNGRLELRRSKWCTRERVKAWLAEMGPIAALLHTAEDRVAARVATELDPRMQRLDWQGLATWAPARARVIADTMPPNADPAVVVGAAELRGDVARMESLLRTTDHSEALQALADWARRAKRADLASLLAARIGVPPTEAWGAILRALADLGGRDEMALLHEVASGAGYPPDARTLADKAMIAIRARLGHQRAGAVTIADAAGGAVSVTDNAGEGSLSRPDLARDQPSTTERGGPTRRSNPERV